MHLLGKLRAGEPLTKAEQATHEQGLVSVLRQLHDEIDAAVFDAYGWPAALTEEEILTPLVSLNAERAAEEARGVIRWLRPDYQARVAQAAPVAAEEAAEAAVGVAPAARPWPGTLAEQAAAVRAALTGLGHPASAADVAAAFDAAPLGPVGEWLAALVALGQARDAGDGRFVAG